MITIGAMARQSGIPAETLRKWEARYGFPVPQRTANGHREFHPHDIAALVEISRLTAQGQRTGAAIRAVKQRALLDTRPAIAPYFSPRAEVSQALALLQQHKLAQLEGFIDEQIAQQGMQAFSRELAIPLIEAVGRLWQQGSLPVFTEHLLTSTLQTAASRGMRRPGAPRLDAIRVLLATPAGEVHTLALVLMNAILQDAGISTVFLQGSLPASEIAAAAMAYGADVIALSASVCFPPRLLRSELLSLRELLPAQVQIWVGGAGIHRVPRPMQGISVTTSIDSAVQALKELALLAPTTNENAQKVHRRCND